MNKDVFDGENWDLSDHDSTKSIGDAGVDADEGEGGIEGVVFVELDLEILAGLLGGVFEKRSWRGGKGSTWENLSRLHSWSSPGWWPGKSVDVTWVTVSALTPTIFVGLAYKDWRRVLGIIPSAAELRRAILALEP